MVLVRSSSCTVVPKYPTPLVPMSLSELDQIQPLIHTPIIFLYNASPNNFTDAKAKYDAMKNSLSSVLVHYYPLAGRLQRIRNGDRFMLQCNAMGAWLFEATSGSKMEDYGDFAPTEAVIKDLTPEFDYNTPIETWPLLLVQLTRFSCGGLCVAVAFSHLVLDGLGAFQFINSWAKLARGECLHEAQIPFHDRVVLLSSHDPVILPCFDHVEYKPPPLLLGCSDTKTQQEKETSVEVLKVTKEQVEMLKKKANESSKVDKMGLAKKPYSTYEAIAGHIWRSACRARQGETHQPTIVRIVSNIRHKLKPQIPLKYSGNGVHRILTPISLYGDILFKPLSCAAQRIRDATEMFTDEYIRSSMDFVAAQEHVDWMRERSREPYFYGNPNLNIGSYLNMPVYDADFGWGKPIFVGIGFLIFDGDAFIIPSPAGDRSVIITLALQTRHMEAFKKFFYESVATSHEDKLEQLSKARL